ncbi:MAG: 30S ribosomal protein S21 [Candidatus Margulisbacteria bacterium]|jgi:small subunit ribosomal protein S21|nr:30S ribosomal protein S21 [Candidatus Margulisiibacteriota bacterium]MDR1323869.1 30S ribosomal protein S21 [Candidatus Margulisiibacteriota bacterium]
MAYAQARDNEDIEKILRRFKRQVKDENILQDLREREVYEKPSEMRKKEQRERERQNHRRMRLEEY